MCNKKLQLNGKNEIKGNAAAALCRYLCPETIYNGNIQLRTCLAYV